RGNANQGGRRQVTLIEKEIWSDLGEKFPGLDPSLRRANLLVSGIALKESVGKIIQIGNCRLRILGKTDPCPRMDEARSGLQAALHGNWFGGVYGECLDDGVIQIGDAVSWAAGDLKVPQSTT
ncbi:MAG: MOSC domain-containing protein, partial [Spirochaetia bacterium]|nr:MOSC domain-containing protein [Spirochaetia bacterium]